MVLMRCAHEGPCERTRHVRDAERLLSHSPDQSWHLAGFGPECARKACLDDPWLDRVLGHDFTDASDAVLDIALALDVRASRYRLTDILQRHPALASWNVGSRYERTGTRSKKSAGELVDQAAQLTWRLAAELWMDGRVVLGA